MTGDIRDELEQLFAEATALAGCLRESARQAHGALSLAGHAVLRLLEEHRALTVPQMARLRGTSRQSMQVLVDRLADAHWVEYVANPDHQRSELLRLTGGGVRLLATAEQRQAAWLAGLLPHVSERALRTGIRQLQQIHTLLRQHSGLPPRPQASASSAEAARPALRRRQSRRVRVAKTPDPVAASIVAKPPAEAAVVQTGGIEELPVTLL